MKALTIWQPWAGAVAAGIMRQEAGPRNTGDRLRFILP